MCSHCSVQGHPTCCLVFSVLKAQTDHLRAHKEHQTNTRKRNFKVQQHSSNFPMIIFMLKGKPCPKLSFFCSVCLQVLPVCLSGSCVLLSGGTNTDKLGWLRIPEPGWTSIRKLGKAKDTYSTASLSYDKQSVFVLLIKI